MQKTRTLLRQKWDAKLALFVKTSFERFEEEISEHGHFIKWVFKYVIVPLCIFFLLAGFFFQENMMGSLFIGLLIFLYSNFVPDLDSLLTPTGNREKTRHNRFEKYGLLFAGPLFLYYLLSGEAKPVFVPKAKEFHQTRYLLFYTAFLLLVGLIFWQHPLKNLVLPIFGFLGYATHLFVDGYFKALNRFLKKNQKTA